MDGAVKHPMPVLRQKPAEPGGLQCVRLTSAAVASGAALLLGSRHKLFPFYTFYCLGTGATLLSFVLALAFFLGELLYFKTLSWKRALQPLIVAGATAARLCS